MAQNKVLKNIPKTETICLKLKNEEGKLMHIITEKFTGIAKEYIIYKVEEDNTYSLLGKGNNPSKLEEKYACKRKEKE